MIYCGELVFFKGEGENDGIIEDVKGVIVGRVQDRNSFKKWFGRMWSEKGVDNGKTKVSPRSSSLPSTSSDSNGVWGKYHEEIEQYFNQLVSSNEEGTDNYVTDDILMNDSPDSDTLKNMVTKDKIEAVKAKISLTQEATELFRKQATVNIERQKRAEWAISLCTSRVETLTTSIEDEISKRLVIQKELDSRKETISELQSEVEEKRSKLNSILELQHELSSKLKSSNLEKSQAEFQLEKAVQTRTRMVHEIEDIRGQRDVLQRRIEFCREKDAIGNASRMSGVDVSFDYRMFNADEIRAATNDFASCLRFKSGRQWTNVYKGHLKHITVAIKLYDPSKFQSEDFLSVVELHGNIRHPHLIGIIGFCSELNCIVFEYMHNGCLRDRLFSNLKCSKGQNHILSWHDRVRIVAEICSGVAFLHQAHPRPIVHGNLDPSKILLDRFNSTKIFGYKAPLSSNESHDIQYDIMAFGNVILQILTGRNFAVLDDETIKIDSTAIIGFLDDQPGEWPQDLAIQLCNTAVMCLSRINIEAQDLNMNELMRDVDKIKQKADELVGKGKQLATNNTDEGRCSADSVDLPSIFFCPIYQDIMKHPYVAADGFSYELEAIQGWLATGRNSSPMTNLKLKHTLLTPNHALRSLIEEWHNKRSIPLV
ncbi:hypothetical protein Leryth_006428 [Lithospermum erythrorhizon]|nr:hypothetical protein Leryth_006428 [Lithospermum erythrorhizon]